MMSDAVSFREGSPRQLGMCCRISSQQEERGSYAFAFEGV